MDSTGEELGGEGMFGLTGEQALKVAEVEMQMMSTFFDNMVSHCFNKCVGKLSYNVNANNYNNGILSIKELSCTDRCVQKYIQSQEITKKRIEKMDQQKQQQLELTMQAQQKIENLTAKFS